VRVDIDPMMEFRPPAATQESPNASGIHTEVGEVRATEDPVPGAGMLPDVVADAAELSLARRWCHA
jgi:hypothetical protein